MPIIHQRICITKTTYKEPCPYCKVRPIRLKTCGEAVCQYTHHLLAMRKVRKTERRVPCRTTSTILITS